MWLGVSLCVCVGRGGFPFMAERNNFHFKRICRPRPMLLFLICHFGPLPSATSVILFHPALWPFGIQNSFALLLFCHCFISSARHFSSALCEVDRGFQGIGDGGGFFPELIDSFARSSLCFLVLYFSASTRAKLKTFARLHGLRFVVCSTAGPLLNRLTSRLTPILTVTSAT